MHGATLYLLGVLIVTVFLLVHAEILGYRRRIYVLKPVSTLFVIAIAILRLRACGGVSLLGWGVLAGLALSLAGDIALMFPRSARAFRLGLGMFLLAHIVYAAAFTVRSAYGVVDIAVALALVALGMAFFLLLRRGLGTMTAPVIAYILVISLMVHRAAGAYLHDVFGRDAGTAIFVGAVLFYVSDIMLASARFWKPWKYNRISLFFYYAGQVLFAVAGSCS